MNNLSPTLKGNKMGNGIASLVGKRISKKTSFCGESISISKLTVSEVQSIQEVAKTAADNSGDGYELLRTVIRNSVEDAKELSDEDFLGFPLDELNKLAQEIMKFSGMNSEQGKS